MSNPTIDDVSAMLRRGDTIALKSEYATLSVGFIKAFAIVCGLGGFFINALMFVAVGKVNLVEGVVPIAIGVAFAVMVLGTGMNRAVGEIKGDDITLKNLMTGRKYKIRLDAITKISINSADTGYGFGRIYGSSQKLMQTSVTFKAGGKERTLVLFNNKKWQFGADLSVADVIWLAREEVYRKE